jgi:antitoxin (DNA-binding transcriptional repressor) of toxin-antitoxin stability system
MHIPNLIWQYVLMMTVTAAHAARNVAGLPDAVGHGETVAATRDGVPAGRFTPADQLRAVLREHPADAGFAGDLLAARADIRASSSEEARGWPGG